MSNLVISALRRLIPEQIRIASFIVIIAGFVTLIDMLLKAFLPAISESLGIFIPLIVVNCIILARAESFARKNTVVLSMIDGASVGVGFTLALVVLAFFRELLGAGSLMGYELFPAPLPIFLLPPGGFIALGLILATISAIRSFWND
jgi:electron transport complex protein RnfE